MSLLDGNEQVTIYPSVTVEDDLGNKLESAEGDPIELVAAVQPQTVIEDATAGQVAGEVRNLICRSFPAGPWARVHWDGRDWDVIGEPKRYGRSPRTAHDVVQIRTRDRRP